MPFIWNSNKLNANTFFFFLALHVENRDLFKDIFYRKQIENKMYFAQALTFLLPADCNLTAKWVIENAREEKQFKNYLNKSTLMRDGEAKAQRVGGLR